jgi:hypothetical protein
VKVEHRHPAGILQPHVILQSKWEVISMDFIVGLSMTMRRQYLIFVVVDTLTKSAHVIPVKTTYQALEIVRMFINEIVRLHGISENIISDRESVFIRRIWTSFREALGTKLDFSATYHPDIDGHIEMTNYIWEDMLQMYIMDQQKCWEEYLLLVEFAYNNSYQSSIKMASFFTIQILVQKIM